MTEQGLIANAMTVSVFVVPICSFLNAKLAWDEAKWLFCNAFIPVWFVYTDRYLHTIGMGSKTPNPDLSNYTPFCWRFIIPTLWHSALMIWGIYFTIWGAIFTYECAKWIFNLIFGG